MSIKKVQQRDIGIAINDMTEFIVIQPVIDILMKKYDVDLIVPYDSGYGELPKHTRRRIQSLGYRAFDDTPDVQYKVVLAPHPNPNFLPRFKYIYLISYPYGALNVKPKPCSKPDWKIPFHAIISFNIYDQEIFKAYGAQTYTVPYWRYYNFKKKNLKHGEKPNLVFLPTFGSDTSCIDDLTEEAVQKIKTKYNFITKSHHATNYRQDEKKSLKLLQEMSDVFYDSDTSIIDLLKQADVVLSDNSSAIFEAICADIPVAIFCRDPNVRAYNGIDTYHYKLVQQGCIPYTSNPEHILTIVNQAPRLLKKQQQIKKQLFLPIDKNSEEKFVEIIEDYLNRNPEEDHYKILHDAMISDFKSKKDRIQQLETDNKNKDSMIQSYEKSRSWKITRPLRIASKYITKH